MARGQPGAGRAEASPGRTGPTCSTHVAPTGTVGSGAAPRPGRENRVSEDPQGLATR